MRKPQEGLPGAISCAELRRERRRKRSSRKEVGTAENVSQPEAVSSTALGASVSTGRGVADEGKAQEGNDAAATTTAAYQSASTNELEDWLDSVLDA